MKKIAASVTIHDVAQRAGVSTSTVSKYINNTPYVSERTKKKIQQAISELNFQPSFIARSLAKQETGYLGVLIPEITNPYYPDLIHAIETEAGKKGYYLILGNTKEDSGHEIQLARELGKRVDGLIFASVTNDSKQLNKLLDEGYHFSMVSRHVEEVDTDFTVVDGFVGAKMAVEHLIRLGHTRIGHIGGPKNIYQFRERYNGYESTLQSYGLYKNPEWVVLGEPSIQSGYRMAVQMMSQIDRPTAIFVGNDTLALGVLESCQHYGWKVPGDIAIVSHDNISLSRLASVPLTTVDGRISELGQFAVQNMVERLRGESHGSPKKIILKPSLVIRSSCGS